MLGCLDKVRLKEEGNNSLTLFYSFVSVHVTHIFFSTGIDTALLLCL